MLRPSVNIPTAFLLASSLAVACGDEKDDGTTTGTSAAEATADGGETSDGGDSADDGETSDGGDSADGGTTTGGDSADGGTTSGGSADDGTSAGDGTTTGEPPYECPNGTLDNEPLPASVMGNTEDGFAMQGAKCDSNMSPGRELVYTFTSPADGFYEFVTTSANEFADTVLFVTEGEDCAGTTIACGDETSSDMNSPLATSNVAAWLAQDEVVQVVVDSKTFTGTEFTLTVDTVAGDCPDEVVTDQTLPLTLNGSTAAPNRITGSCFGEAGEYIYQWTAPQTATYEMNTQGSSATHEDTVLYVIDGTSCGGTELACNDDIMLGMDRDSKLEVDLTADQEILIVVDGWSGSINGDFVLNILIP